MINKAVNKYFIKNSWICTRCGIRNSNDFDTCNRCYPKKINNFIGLWKRECNKCFERKHISHFRAKIKGNPLYKSCKHCRQTKPII